MKTKIFFYSLLAFVFIACKKNNSTSTPQATLLTKQVISYSTEPILKDSVFYTYNGNDRIIKKQTKGINGQSAVITRNTSNIITHVEYGDRSQSVSFDPLTLHYLYSINTGSYAPDSTVYIYTNNQITARIDYIDQGSGYEPEWKSEYSYDVNGNILHISHYLYDFTYWLLIGNNNFTYDDKVNPFVINNERFIILRDGQPEPAITDPIGMNNIMSQSYSGMGETHNWTYVYTYNSDNTPSTLTRTSETGDFDITTYYY